MNESAVLKPIKEKKSGATSSTEKTISKSGQLRNIIKELKILESSMRDVEIKKTLNNISDDSKKVYFLEEELRNARLQLEREKLASKDVERKVSGAEKKVQDLSVEIDKKDADIRNMKKVIRELIEINSKQANEDFITFKAKISADVRRIKSDVDTNLSIISDDRTKALFLEDALDNMINILKSSGISV